MLPNSLLISPEALKSSALATKCAFFFYFWRVDQRLSSWYLWIHCSIINQVYIYLDMQLYFFANMYFNITLLSLDLSPIFRDLHAFIYKSFFPIFFFHYQWYEFKYHRFFLIFISEFFRRKLYSRKSWYTYNVINYFNQERTTWALCHIFSIS